MILVAVLWVVGVAIVIYKTSPYTAKEAIYLPKTSHIANYVDGKFILVSEAKLSGTLLYLPFDDFKNQFGNVPTTVIVQSDGMLYYLSKKDGLSYATKRDYGKGRDRHRQVLGLKESILTIGYGRNENGLAPAICALSIIAIASGLAIFSKAIQTN
jgi:hypothetical protein